jgi:lantibiotic modifying enzyme
MSILLLYCPMQKELKNKTAEIVDIVAKEKFDSKIGLLSGTAGSLFLLCYYNEYTKSSTYMDIVEQRVMDAFDVINDTQFSNLTYSNGLTGFLWALKNLNEHEYIDIDLSDVTDSANPLLGEFMMAKMDAGEYDFLHGSLGVANYFLDAEGPLAIQLVKEFNQKLFAKSIRDEEDTLSFLSTVNISDTIVPVVNLSLSHGMASIIYYLQRCLQNKNIASEEIKKALQQIISFYRKNQNDISVESSYFPSWISNGSPNVKGRLAWCYGDLGVGLVFYKVADVLNDPELKAYAIKILKNTLTRLDPVKESIKEGGICHGGSGLVKMYRTIYRTTGINDFNSAADHWLKVTLEQAIHADGYAGYKTYAGERGYENDCGLLEGVGGIGIVFLEELMGKSLPWDRSLLLS